MVFFYYVQAKHKYTTWKYTVNLHNIIINGKTKLLTEIIV